MAVLDRERIVDALGAFLAQYPEVRFAYLYGSRAFGYARPDSDVDIAAYFNVDPPHAPELEPDLARRLGLHVQVINLNERPAADFFLKALPTAVVIKDSPERVRWEKETGGMVRKKKVTQKDYLMCALDAMEEKNARLCKALPLLDTIDLDRVRRDDMPAVQSFLGAFFTVFEPLESIARRMANDVAKSSRAKNQTDARR